MNSTSCFRGLLAFLLLAVGVGHSQPAPDASPVSVRFFSIEEPLGELIVQGGKIERTIETTPFVPGPVLEWPAGTREFVLYREEVKAEAQSATGKGNVKTRRKLAVLSLPAAGNEFTAALWNSRGQDGVAELRSWILGGDGRAFGPQQVRVVNLSAKPVALRLGTSVENIEPKATRYFAPSLDERNRLVVESAAFEDGRWQKFDFAVLGLRPDRKATLLLTESRHILGLRGDSRGVDADGRPMTKMVMVSWFDRAANKTLAAVAPSNLTSR